MRGLGAGQRIFELLEREPVIPLTGKTVPPSSRGPIQFENVSFEYPSRKGVKVLKNLNLKLDVGESVAIVYVVFFLSVFFLLLLLLSLFDRDLNVNPYRGQSGSGKSSVQSLLLRFYDPVSGRVTFNGTGKVLG